MVDFSGKVNERPHPTCCSSLFIRWRAEIPIYFIECLDRERISRLQIQARSALHNLENHELQESSALFLCGVLALWSYRFGLFFPLLFSTSLTLVLRLAAGFPSPRLALFGFPNFQLDLGLGSTGSKSIWATLYHVRNHRYYFIQNWSFTLRFFRTDFVLILT